MTPAPFPPTPTAPARVAIPVTASAQAVLDALRGRRYGTVEVVVHSDRIVQITRSQKLRVDAR